MSGSTMHVSFELLQQVLGLPASVEITGVICTDGQGVRFHVAGKGVPDGAAIAPRYVRSRITLPRFDGWDRVDERATLKAE